MMCLKPLNRDVLAKPPFEFGHGEAITVNRNQHMALYIDVPISFNLCFQKWSKLLKLLNEIILTKSGYE